MTHPTATAIIPARYASARFAGKVLADRTGKPLIQHVHERAARASLVDRVIVATDDQRIVDAVAAFGDGGTYAQYFFYQKLGPALKSVLASTEGPFAEIFRSLSKPPPESKVGGSQARVKGGQP